MNTFLDLLFIANLSLLLMGHELDAIKQKEWRFFFARLPLSDQTAFRWFTALHVPIFILMIWYLNDSRFQLGFDLFLILHASLHWLLRDNPHINFASWFSRLWIYGGALSGAVHLALLLLL